MGVGVLSIPVHDPCPFELFPGSLLEGPDHVQRCCSEVRRSTIFRGDDDLEHPGITCLLPLIRNGVERPVILRIETLMLVASLLASGTFALLVTSVCFPGTLHARVGIPNVDY